MTAGIIILIIVEALLLLTLIILGITSFCYKGYSTGVCCLLFALLPALWIISVVSNNGKTREVEYRFPAADYKFSTEITITAEKKVVGNDTVIVVSNDTTYVLTGNEPIIRRPSVTIEKK